MNILPWINFYIQVSKSNDGFRKGHSTGLAVIELDDRVSEYLDSVKLPISVFFGFIKSVWYAQSFYFVG